MYLRRIMPRTRKCNPFRSFYTARAMKVARLNEAFPQSELRRLEQAEREATYTAVETPEQAQAHRQNAQHYLGI
ncbi:hypothetical protein TNCV_3590941 [Trichonephila clavipes]|nr:hypothetical protein TNCV_3590941 [Trichonephila clavipes]